jgi:hypothetical protein
VKTSPVRRAAARLGAAAAPALLLLALACPTARAAASLAPHEAHRRAPQGSVPGRDARSADALVRRARPPAQEVEAQPADPPAAGRSAEAGDDANLRPESGETSPEAPPEQNAAAQAVPDAIPATLAPKPGIFYIDYGSYRWTPASCPVSGAMRVFNWSDFNPSAGVYDFTALDAWMADRKSLGLITGIMTSVYDGAGSGDIRGTPNFVIATPGAVVPATAKTCSTCATYPHYINGWSRSNLNGGFDYSNHEYLWTKSGSVSVVDGPDTGTNYAARLGGANNATGSIYHYDLRIPAMPPGITDATEHAWVEFRAYIDTADAAAGDHLIMELWDTSNRKIPGGEIDITNLAHTNRTWKTYTFDIDSFGLAKTVRVALRVTTNGSGETTFYVDDIKPKFRHLIPKYHSSAFQDAYRQFIMALGERYRNNPDLQFVSFGSGLYGENQPTQDTAFPESHFDHVMVAAGLTTELWTAYVNAVSQAHADAFASGPGLPPNRSVMVQYAPVYLSSTEKKDTTDYAAARGVGLSANFLSPDFTQVYRTNLTGQYDPMAGWGGQVPLAMEGYDSDLCNPVLSFMAMAHALDKHVDYLRVDAPLISDYTTCNKPDNPSIAWARNYIGRTPANTPGAWVMMREHRNPTATTCRPGAVIYTAATGFTTHPDLGNFEFYVKQVDTIAGGRTVAETNDKGVDSRYAKDPANGAARPDAGLGNCPQLSYRTDLFGAPDHLVPYPCNPTPYNPNLPPLVGQNPADYTDYYALADWTGEGKEAYTVRRTDQATGNPYMFFKVDDAYIPGTATIEATLTVKYFDIGTDRFTVKYHSATGEKSAGTVTKTGSKALKTATFTVADGRFGNGLAGGSDFYIDSRNGTTNDGDEWIHFVEIVRASGPAAPVASIRASGTAALLAWPAVTKDAAGNPITVSRYDVWRNTTTPYFTPGGTPAGQTTGLSWSDAGAMTAADTRFYAVTAVDSAGRQGAGSNRTGKFTFGLLR